MNIFESLKEDILRPIAVTLFPAAIASSPIAYAALKTFPPLGRFYEQHEATSISVLFILLIGVGFILEDLGTRVEVVIDWLLKKRHADFDDVWDKYLRCRLDDPHPFAQGYIRRLLVRYKFELSLFCAFLIAALGTVGVAFKITGFRPLPIALLVVFLVGAFWSVYEAYASGGLMHENRKRVLSV